MRWQGFPALSILPRLSSSVHMTNLQLRAPGRPASKLPRPRETAASRRSDATPGSCSARSADPRSYPGRRDREARPPPRSHPRGFYWFFDSRNELLDELLADWERTNTEAFKATLLDPGHNGMAEFQAMVDMWVAEAGYSPAWDAAIRDWAGSPRKSPRWYAGLMTSASTS